MHAKRVAPGYRGVRSRNTRQREGGRRRAGNGLYTRQPYAIFEVDNGVVYDWRHWNSPLDTRRGSSPLPLHNVAYDNLCTFDRSEQGRLYIFFFYSNTIDQEIHYDTLSCTVEMCFFRAKFYSNSTEQRGKTVSIEIREWARLFFDFIIISIPGSLVCENTEAEREGRFHLTTKETLWKADDTLPLPLLLPH